MHHNTLFTARSQLRINLIKDLCDATDAPGHDFNGTLCTYDVLTCDGRGGQDVGTTPFNCLATQAAANWADGQLSRGDYHEQDDRCWVLSDEAQNNVVGPNHEDYNVLGDSMAFIRDTQRNLAYNEVQQATSNSYGLRLFLALALSEDYCG